MKSYKSPANWYQLNLPKCWEVEEGKNEVSFFDPKNGIGAFQISAYECPDGDCVNSVDELKTYLSNNDISIDGEKLTDSIVSNKAIATYEYCDHDGRFWKLWIISNNQKFLFLTYNCPNNDINQKPELRLVNQIVSSIEIR